ncbi:MAG TPA: hypothetical protein DDZ89_13095 [Clostridiales bacterium]|nr:hypothetical protein [Clostridiales bacterium]
MKKACVRMVLIILASGVLFLASCTGNENQTGEETTTITKAEVTGQTLETTQETTVTLKPVTEQTEKKETQSTVIAVTTKPDFSKMTDLEKYRWEREQLKNDPERKFLYDNDGNEIVYNTNEVTVESALETRFYPLKGSAVDTVFYTPWSSGFHMYTHDTKVGQIFDTTESNFSNNKARAFIDAGIDYFDAMVKYCHGNGMEIFFGMRMNDTHDNQGGWYGELMLKVNKFKMDHPELLVGEAGKNPIYGTWTSVDFTHKIIRDMVYSIFEEACQNYDIDGIHLDFFRHPCFFKDAANGNPLKQETLDLMTDMMRQIREMTEREGMKRKKPILVSVRVPDSVEFCRAIGLDLEQWLSEDLVDFLCTSGYTQMNDWEYSVELGHKYGARVYPSIDETRVRDDNANKSRMSVESYYARLSNVWDAGADGFLLFNFYNYSSPIFKTGNDPEKFLNFNKHYFASYRGVGYFSRTWPHLDFINIPTVNPYDKLELKKGQLEEVVFRIGENLEKAKEKGKTPTVYLRLSLEQAKKKDKIIVEFNDKILERPLTIPSILAYKLEPTDIRKGLNTLKLMIHPEGDEVLFITDIVVDFYYN